MEYKLLGKIEKPDDLKKLNINELNLLCAEIRDCIINTVSKNGGHLASSLGAVELTLAIHRSFNAPEDAIIFDVGHQCYAHKLITGRYKDFSTIRLESGISGFMRPSESVYDPFVTGHSSNSVSAAFGIYKAKQLSGEGGTAVAVIGDGALTGGMAYEALNNVGGGRNKFIIILNDNKMSISRNVGAMARTLTKMRNKPRYHYFKFAVNRFLSKIPHIGKYLARFIFSLKELLKSLIYRNNFFKTLGINYLGPVDGHDIKAMESLFKVAQNYVRPTLIHVVTVKGKGYDFAENMPKDYHGVSPFDIKEGQNNTLKETFSSVAGKTLCSVAKENSKICAVTAAMTAGTGLLEFSKLYKERFFDVGIAEQHAVTFAAGLASAGMIPYFAVYSSFLQRGFDQVLHDAAIANLPLKLLVDRAGIVGQDGETHQGLFDVAFLRLIPNMNIFSPASYKELSDLIRKTAEDDKLTAIRYPRGAEKREYDLDFSGEYSVFGENKKQLVLTYGRIFDSCFEAYEKCGNFTLIKLNKIYPLSQKLIKEISGYKVVHFFEEAVYSGSVAELLGCEILKCGFGGKYYPHTVADKFVAAMSQEAALKKYNLDTQSIIKITGETDE